MKTTTVYQNPINRPAAPYPNAASRRKLLNKFVDQLLVCAMGVACITALLFFMTLA